jgi:hypothetical protein
MSLDASCSCQNRVFVVKTIDNIRKSNLPLEFEVENVVDQ